MGANKLFGGYPEMVGHHAVALLRHQGPASYTAITTGTSPTGGDSLSPPMFGLKWVENIIPATSEDGAYLVVPLLVGQGASQTILLRWFVMAGGPPGALAEEVTTGVDLSAIHVRLQAIGLP